MTLMQINIFNISPLRKFDQNEHYTKKMSKNDYIYGYLIYKYSVHILQDVIESKCL